MQQYVVFAEGSIKCYKKDRLLFEKKMTKEELLRLIILFADYMKRSPE